MEPSLCMHFQKIYLSTILEGSTDPGQQGTDGSTPGLFAVYLSFVLPKNCFHVHCQRGDQLGPDLEVYRRCLEAYGVLNGTQSSKAPWENYFNSPFRKEMLTQANQRSPGRVAQSLRSPSHWEWPVESFLSLPPKVKTNWLDKEIETHVSICIYFDF